MKSFFVLVIVNFAIQSTSLLSEPPNMPFTQGHCLSCEGGVALLTQEMLAEFLEVFSDWALISRAPKKIERKFVFKDFVQAMKFVNRIAEIAQREGHHPDIYIFYNKVTIQFYTHAINGLSVNDFIMAGLIDDLLYEQRY